MGRKNSEKSVRGFVGLSLSVCLSISVCVCLSQSVYLFVCLSVIKKGLYSVGTVIVCIWEIWWGTLGNGMGME